jgi:hypothetical protein
MKKINILKCLIIPILFLVTATVFPCCSRGAESISKGPGLLQDEVEFNMLSAADLGGSYATSAIVKNNSGKLYSFNIELLYYGRNDRLLNTEHGVILDLYPGMEKAFFHLTSENWSGAKRIEARVTNIIKAEDCSITPDFIFNNLSVHHHEHGTNVYGEVTNLDDMQYSIIILAVVYDGHGNPVKANIHGIDNIYPGETRVLSAPLIGEDTDETDCRVYLESITSVSEAKEKVNIEFLNAAINYDSGTDRSSVVFDIINHDNLAYRNIGLLFGLYDEDKLLNVIQSYIMSIGPEESTHFDQTLMEGNWEDYELKININSFAEDV